MSSDTVEMVGHIGGFSEAMLEAKQQRVREKIEAALQSFRGADMCAETRLMMKLEAAKIGRQAAREYGVRVPKVAVDISDKDPAQVEVRIAFPQAEVVEFRRKS